MLSDIAKVRLEIGDTNTNEPYLEDSVVTFLLDENGNDILEASIAALTAIANQLALSPDRERIGDVEEYKASLDDIERRLQALISKRNAKKYQAIPIILNSDRKNWDDIDKIFGDC